MMIHKIIPSVDFNEWLKHVDTQLNEPTNQNSIKALKLLIQRIRKRYILTLGTSVINSVMSPPSLMNLSNHSGECDVCPCPLTTPSNQFGRTCSIDTDGQVDR